MRFGLALPHYGFSLPGGWHRDGAAPSIAEIVEIAVEAERLGFDSVYVSDHLFLDLGRYGGPSVRFETPEAFALLHAIAAATSRIRLGTLVLCTAFREPAMLALQVASLQDASGGRFVCGLGAGWYEDEFEAAGIPFEGPGRRIERMRAVAARLHEQAAAPTFIGGKGGPKILEAVARDADGWNVCWRATPDFIAERREVLAKTCADAGRDPSEVEITVGLQTLLGRDADDLARRFAALQAWSPGGAIDGVSLQRWAEAGLVGTLDEAETIAADFAEAGAAEIIVSAASVPFALADREQLDLVAQLAARCR